MATNEERRETTRAALLSAARRLFLARGYAETSTAQILAEAGVSKGALYHHFRAKEDLMRAIFAEESARAIDCARRAAGADPSPLARLRAASLAWMAEIREPEAARILMELGPQALGWRQAKAIEEANSLAALRAGLAEAERAGEIGPSATEITARLLNALLAEAALLHLQNGSAAEASIGAFLERFFASLAAGGRA